MRWPYEERRGSLGRYPRCYRENRRRHLARYRSHLSPRGPVGSAQITSCDQGPFTLEALPAVLRSGPYRFFFYSADRDEPPHVHVERGDSEAKFWLNPVRLEWSRGLARTRFGGLRFSLA